MIRRLVGAKDFEVLRDYRIDGSWCVYPSDGSIYPSAHCMSYEYAVLKCKHWNSTSYAFRTWSVYRLGRAMAAYRHLLWVLFAPCRVIRCAYGAVRSFYVEVYYSSKGDRWAQPFESDSFAYEECVKKTHGGSL